ncbi:MAG: hypothetical protein ACYDHN_14005 [Solirubrobacteraceae bacterium]
MSAAEIKQAHKLEVDGIRAEADQEASKANHWATVWRLLARLTDVMAIGLAAVAAATSGVALETVFVSVPAGLAALGAGVGATVRPGQLAARAASAAARWQQLTSDVDRVMSGWDDLDEAEAREQLEYLQHRRDTIRNDAKPKRSEFPPTTW